MRIEDIKTTELPHLMEAFDSSVPFQWVDHTNEDMKLLHAQFQIGDGLFVVQFKNVYYQPGYWEISFTRNETLDLTGTGTAAKVLSTVMKAVREFIKSVDPKYITYAAKNDEASRNKLYPRLALMLKQEFPQYTDRPAKTVGQRKYTSYEFERPSKPFVAPEPPKPAPAPIPLNKEEWDELDAFMDEWMSTNGA